MLSINKIKGTNRSLDSSLGLLKGDAWTEDLDFETTKENLEPNISLGRYLQPAGQESPAAAGEFSTSLSSQPLSDSEDEDELPTVPAAIESQSFEFQPPAPVQTINPTTLAETSNMTEASFNGFSWDKVVKANTADDSSVSQAMHQEVCVHINAFS